MHADHLKLMFPMGWTVATMAWGIIDGQEYLASQRFDGKSNLQWALQTLEYGLEFLLDCSFDSGEFVAQVRSSNSPSHHASVCNRPTFLFPMYGFQNAQTGIPV